VTIRKSVKVGCIPEAAFPIFTRDIGRWWPLKRGFSMDRVRASEVFLDDHSGGQFYERFIDGTE
jgi:hypothetical protein